MTKYMITSRQQNTVQNQNIVIENLSLENVEKFRYLGVTVTNTNDIREEIKRRINMGNACYYSLEKILSSRLLSKKLKVNTYKTIILPVVLYGCETWSLTLREEHRLRVFENKVLRKIFGAKRDEITEEWRKLHNAELHALYSSSNIIKIKSVALQLRRAKTDWSGCCQMAVHVALWLAKRLSLNLHFSFNRISLLLIQVPTQLSPRGWVDPVPDPIPPEKFLGYSRELNPEPLGWQSDVLTTIPNRWSVAVLLGMNRCGSFPLLFALQIAWVLKITPQLSMVIALPAKDDLWQSLSYVASYNEGPGSLYSYGWLRGERRACHNKVITRPAGLMVPVWQLWVVSIATDCKQWPWLGFCLNRTSLVAVWLDTGTFILCLTSSTFGSSLAH